MKPLNEILRGMPWHGDYGAYLVDRAYDSTVLRNWYAFGGGGNPNAIIMHSQVPPAAYEVVNDFNHTAPSFEWTDLMECVVLAVLLFEKQEFNLRDDTEHFTSYLEDFFFTGR